MYEICLKKLCFKYKSLYHTSKIACSHLLNELFIFIQLMTMRILNLRFFLNLNEEPILPDLLYLTGMCYSPYLRHLGWQPRSVLVGLVVYIFFLAHVLYHILVPLLFSSCSYVFYFSLLHR
ncbi:hypothetical protein O6H91_01G081700 [Diphasiastrum complanatum]|uniref:Uncharacterized protein n=1 Tax=Diphasiastrum complanatum TaxID=34168 RepID=A0ACC2ESV1_DIPCM|nr:hypothetical protein O6H91_01G081700 [Diphasiastrum complanatum]